MRYRISTRIIFAIVWCLLGLPGRALAQPSAEPRADRVYAVISLIADALRVLGQEPTTGSRLSRSAVESMPLGFDVLELSSIRAVTSAVLTSDPLAKVLPLKITDPAIYSSQGDFLTGLKASLPSAINESLTGTPVTHLILVTRHRAEAKMRSGSQTLGSGNVEGVGVYLDRETRLRRLDGGNDPAAGYLGLYVYARLSLINIGSLSVERTQTVTEGTVFGVTGSQASADPWLVMDTPAKLNRLRSMMGQSLGAATTRLLERP